MKSSGTSITQNTPTNQLLVEAQGRLLKCRVIVKYTDKKQRSDARRGLVTKYSRKSRKRFLEASARVEVGRGATFITLTYGQIYPLHAQDAKHHLRAFLERIRRLHPSAAGFWRIEWQERGAPHFHLMLYNCPFIEKKIVAAMWAEVVPEKYHDTSTSPYRPPFTRIEWCGTVKKVTYYLSKYVCKASGFNTLPYLHAGRHWGYFNRPKLPLAELVSVIITYLKPVYCQFKRAAHYKFVRISKYSPLCGFTLFTSNPHRWLEYLFFCLFEFS